MVSNFKQSLKFEVKYFWTKTVLLPERNRHTDRRLSSTPSTVLSWGGGGGRGPPSQVQVQMGGTPSQVQMGGIPPPVQTWLGTPHPVMGVPPPRLDGATPIQWWGFETKLISWMHSVMGVPPSDLAGVPPPPIWTWLGYPPYQTWLGYPPVWTWPGYPPRVWTN